MCEREKRAFPEFFFSSSVINIEDFKERKDAFNTSCCALEVCAKLMKASHNNFPSTFYKHIQGSDIHLKLMSLDEPFVQHLHVQPDRQAHKCT